MRTKTIVAGAALAAALLAGCGTLSEPQKLAQLVADARDIADGATTAAMTETKGEARPRLVEAQAALTTLAQLPEGQATVDDLLRVLQGLPLERLQSERGQVYATLGRVLVRRVVPLATDRTVDVGAKGAVRQVSAALADGIGSALGRWRPPPAK